MKVYCPVCQEVTAQGRCACARAKERERTARRGDLYDQAWQAHSRQRREEEPWCHADEVGLPACYSTDTGQLSVDHPTDAVLCDSCHGLLEARRRGLIGGRNHRRGAESVTPRRACVLSVKFKRSGT